MTQLDRIADLPRCFRQSTPAFSNCSESSQKKEDWNAS
jgi:hypothetical protein